MKKTLILLAVFLTACQGGKKVNPNSSGAVNIIRASEVKPPKEHTTMNVIPKGNAAPTKPKIKSKNLPLVPLPAPPTVQRNKLDIVIREPLEGGPAVPMVVSRPMTTWEKMDAWLNKYSELICYYLIAFTFVAMAWLLWSLNNQRRVAIKKPKQQAVRVRKKASAKRPAKKAAKKTTAKKAVKKTAKKKAPKKKS